MMRLPLLLKAPPQVGLAKIDTYSLVVEEMIRAGRSVVPLVDGWQLCKMGRCGASVRPAAPRYLISGTPGGRR